MTNATPTTIDQASRAMDQEVERCLASGDRRGYFAGVYRAVTARIRDGLEADEFADADRMERFDVLFARRYLDSCDGWQRGTSIPAAWRLAFETAALTNRLVLQHLLLGINAHINLDLGLAAADATEPGRVRALQDDFELINDVLADLVDHMQNAIATVSPWSRHTRRDAWEFAVALSERPADARHELAKTRDQHVTSLGLRIAHPRAPLRWVVGAAQRRERHDLDLVFEELRGRGSSP